MKTTKILAMAAMLTVATSASAQFATNNRTSSVSTVSTDGWSSVWVEYNPTTFKVDEKGADDTSVSGLSVGYSKTFGISDKLPLFVEAGVGLQYTFDSDDFDEEDMEDQFGIRMYDVDYFSLKSKFSMFSAKIPVNLMYAFQIPNTTVTVLPYLGVTARLNLSANTKYDIDLDEVEDEDYDDEINKSRIDELKEYYFQDKDHFDKDDMGGSKYTWKRFQLGWQLGVKARFAEKFLVGISYGSDFTEVTSKTKIATTSISLGYTF